MRLAPPRRRLSRPLGAALGLLLALLPAPTPRGAGEARAQAVDVFMNITGGGARKLGIAIPEFTLAGGTDQPRHARLLASVAGEDLTISGLFQVVTGEPPLPLADEAALRQRLRQFAAAGAHAAVQGVLQPRGERLEAEMRLYDLTAGEPRPIATKKFERPAREPRMLAHHIADEIVLQFTGERGIATTKLAYVSGPVGKRELWLVDYDGADARPLTSNGSINLMPSWSPDAAWLRLAYTTYAKSGYPDLWLLFPFVTGEQRERELAAYAGINSSPAWSPDGKRLAVTLTKDGNPDIYVLEAGNPKIVRRLTRHAGIDTDPTWSPDGRQIAFVSEREGRASLWVMGADGGQPQRLGGVSGFVTQPRWSPKGDRIAYTQRQSGGHQILTVGTDGAPPRQLTGAGRNNQGATWAPNGRHLAFQTDRFGGWQVMLMLADGSEQRRIIHTGGEHHSPSWSPRLP